MRAALSMLPELARMGVRNVGRNLRRSLITGAMIAVAVTGVVFFKGYALGIEKALVDMAVEGITGAMQVQRRGYIDSQDLGPLDLDLPDDQTIARALSAVPNVKAVAPRVLFTGFISNGDTSTMFVGLGIDPEKEIQVCPSGPGLTTRTSGGDGYNRLVDGQPLTSRDEESVVLTQALATGLKVKIGDSLTLVARTQGGSTDSVDLTVKGVFQFDDPLGNKQFGVLPLAVAQKLLHMKSRATAFGVSVTDQAQLQQTAKHVSQALAGATPELAVFSWDTLAPYYRDVATLQDGMLDVVFLVVVLIVLAGVINTMMMSTFERKREIGTLMSMGFRRWAIVTLFVVESIWLAALSAVIGVVVGVTLVLLTHSTGIAFSIPAGGSILTHPQWRPQDALVALAGAILTAACAAMFPAYRASRLKPIDALRAD